MRCGIQAVPTVRAGVCIQTKQQRSTQAQAKQNGMDERGITELVNEARTQDPMATMEQTAFPES